jgi:hypothetical protein
MASGVSVRFGTDAANLIHRLRGEDCRLGVSPAPGRMACRQTEREPCREQHEQTAIAHASDDNQPTPKHEKGPATAEAFLLL